MKRRLRLRWSCSDHVKHEHRWYWTARVCGLAQLTWRRITESLHG